MVLAKARGASCSHRCSPLADDSDPSTRAILHDRISRYLGTAKSLLLLVLTWIVGGIQVFEAQRTNGRIAGQNDDATGWKTWLVGSNHCGPTHLNAATS